MQVHGQERQDRQRCVPLCNLRLQIEGSNGSCFGRVWFGLLSCCGNGGVVVLLFWLVLGFCGRGAHRCLHGPLWLTHAVPGVLVLVVTSNWWGPTL